MIKTGFLFEHLQPDHHYYTCAYRHSMVVLKYQQQSPKIIDSSLPLQNDLVESMHEGNTSPKL